MRSALRSPTRLGRRVSSLRHNKSADCQTSRRFIVRCERDAFHFTHVKWRSGFGVRRLKERIRAKFVERNPNQLPHAALQVRPRGVCDTIPIHENDKENLRGWAGLI